MATQLLIAVWCTLTSVGGARADSTSVSEPIELVSDASHAPAIKLPAAPNQLSEEQMLPIDLASALRLSDAQPVVIEIATHALRAEAARWERARVLWLPTIYMGMDYQRNDGATQNSDGTLRFTSRNQMIVGGGASAVFALTDALYEPLAARQLVRARQFDVQSARNDALAATADAYFSVQAARGKLAGTMDAVKKGREVAAIIRGLVGSLAPPLEVDRARATLAALEQLEISAREEWQTASANLTRTLRLDRTAVVTPVEPPEIRVSLIGLDRNADDLVAIGLTTRPELAAYQALVHAALVRLRQERRRPLIPTLIVQGNSSPGQRLAGGLYGAGINSSMNEWNGRLTWDAQVVWELRNLGLGNRALVDERRHQQRQTASEYGRLQDNVAAEVVQACARLISAEQRMVKAEEGLAAAHASFDGNQRGLREAVRAGELLRLVVRPQEVLSALLQLQGAYAAYYGSVTDYNQAQFRLYRSLGYPARDVVCTGRVDTLIAAPANR